jgi:hypothetical protein
MIQLATVSAFIAAHMKISTIYILFPKSGDFWTQLFRGIRTNSLSPDPHFPYYIRIVVYELVYTYLITSNNTYIKIFLSLKYSCNLSCD